MLSVMSNKGFESDRRNDAVPVADLRESTASSSGAGNEAVSSIFTDSGEGKVGDASGMDFDRGVSLVSDSSVEARVPDANSKERSDCKFSGIKNEDRKLNADTKNLGMELIHRSGNSKIDAGHGMIAERSKGTEMKSGISEYDLMLSKFDDFAANGKRWAVGWGYEMGDMVWGKVKSHPWWPGHIFHEEFATTAVQRSKRDGHILVAFFGDSSYGWFEPSELVPFEPHFRDKSQQTNLRSFTKAVEEAIDELSRRCALGLLCRCRQADNFRPVSSEGYFEVDLNENEKNFIYTASQIKKARESFHPREILAFTKKLALTPLSGDYGSIDFIKNKAIALGYRKAVFATHDPTYAEAFGSHVPKHLQQTHPVTQPSKERPRASLSGRLVSMEAMGKGKSSGKHNKAGQTEKDRYLFKRRDEPENLKSHKVGEVQAGSSSHGDSSAFLEKGTFPSVTDNVKCASGTNSVEEQEKFQNQDLAVGELHISDPTEAKPQGEGVKARSHGGTEKVKKKRKRPASEASSGTSELLEKKKKKKKILSTNMGSNSVEKQITGEGDYVTVPSDAREDIQMEYEKKGDGASISFPEQAVSQQSIEIKTVEELELPQLLCDLRTLALNPFHGLERSCPTTTRTLFLRFRSLVFQKSLASSPSENELNQAPSSKLPAERMRETAPMKMQQKSSSARPDDPTRGGRKRGPSDRQEEISAKKKKKMGDLKSLAAERKASQRASEVPKSDGKEMVTKTSIPSKTSKPEISKRMEQEPTMLIMKFPLKGSLPSIPELKVKFARFGPLDHKATRIFWKSSTCRLVYHYKHHAEAALKFAESSTNLFGNTDVKCSLREAEAPETSVAKVDNSAKDSVAADRPAAARGGPQQPAAQLKSILKRPPGEENGGNGNGNNRGTRVKFDLGGEDSTNRGENTKTTDIAASSSSDTTTNVKNFSKVILPSTSQLPPTMPPPVISTVQFQNPTTNVVHFPEVVVSQRNMHNFNTPSAPLATSTTTTNADISQPMLSLLAKCCEVMTNLTNSLGYTPYRPL